MYAFASYVLSPLFNFELCWQYESYLVKNKSTLSSHDYIRYRKQHSLLKDVCRHYELEPLADSEIKERHFEQLLYLLEQVSYLEWNVEWNEFPWMECGCISYMISVKDLHVLCFLCKMYRLHFLYRMDMLHVFYTWCAFIIWLIVCIDAFWRFLLAFYWYLLVSVVS